MRNLINFQVFKATKNPKIMLENCFDTIIWSFYIQKIPKSSKLNQSKSMAKGVLSPPPTTVPCYSISIHSIGKSQNQAHSAHNISVLIFLSFLCVWHKNKRSNRKITVFLLSRSPLFYYLWRIVEYHGNLKSFSSTKLIFMAI